ncbi:MAG: hypothetical protein ACRDRK_05175 [Pseudonocardia sp.]
MSSDEEHDMPLSSTSPISATVPAGLVDAATVTAHPAVTDISVEIGV